MIDYYKLALDNYPDRYAEAQLNVFVEKGKITKKQKGDIMEIKAREEVKHDESN